MSKKYKRVLLKLSGESLAGNGSFGIDFETIKKVAKDIKPVYEKENLELGIVIGGGNIFRGDIGTDHGLDKATCDYMGMLATAINALAVQEVFESLGMSTRVQTAIRMTSIAEPYIRRRSLRHFEKGRIVIFGCGTGNPYFTTDTAAALRAMEIGADVLIKATRVDGVYDKDPLKQKDAQKFEKLTYIDVLQKNLKVMDSAAVSLCMDHKLPIVVFDLTKEGNLQKILSGENIGTVVC